MKVKKITLIGLLAACLCILAPVSFPIGVIPISLATFAIYIIASLLVWHNTILVILVYIVIGAVGLPVFSGFRGGFSILLGYTGGYIFGYTALDQQNSAMTWTYQQYYNGKYYYFNIPSSIRNVTLSSGLVSIYKAFINCTNLKSICYEGTLDDWVQIEFKQCTHLLFLFLKLKKPYPSTYLLFQQMVFLLSPHQLLALHQ